MRIFNVTVSREMDFTIAAESETALDVALSRADFNEWSPPDWDWTVSDTLKRLRTDADLERYPDNAEMPDMWVNGKNQVLDHTDFDGDLIALIERAILEHKKKVYQSLHQMPLPGIE